MSRARGSAGTYVSRQEWIEPELRILRQHYRSGGPRRCAELLPWRSESAIVGRARRLGLQRTKPGWLTSELALLKREYPVGGLAGCIAVLPKRSEQAIYQMAFKLGLSAPPYPSLKKAVGEAAVLREQLRALREKLASAEARIRDERGRVAGLTRALELQRIVQPARAAA